MIPPIKVSIRPTDWVEQNIYLKGKPFSFKGREYLKPIYDSPYPKRFLKAGRQVEKTVSVKLNILMSDGSWKRAEDVQVGDRLCTLDVHTSRIVVAPVTWKSQVYTKPCRKVTTMLGHELVMAGTHPVRFWNRWAETSELTVGDRLAAVRSSGEFGSAIIDRSRIEITAALIGDGNICENNVGLTGCPGPLVDRFTACLEEVGSGWSVYPKKGTTAVQVRVCKGPVRGWVTEDGLMGKKSATKFLPSWVFRLPKQDAALFLNRLWSTDGHVKKNGPSKYSIEYCSISTRLIKEVQSMLWKFGIPSTIRKNWPNIYKKRGELKYAYILRVVTSEGVRRFLAEIGALGKSEGVPLPDAKQNNNRDTLPDEAKGLIREIQESVPVRVGRCAENTLYSNGLRLSPKYPLTYTKAAQYVKYFREDGEYDPEKVGRLEAMLDTDIYWDRVEKIEEVGDQECVDFEVEGHHNFIAEGLITHNSTGLANISIAETYCAPYTNCLYVSSSSIQTSVFSTGYIKATLMDSPGLLGSFYRPGSAKFTDKVYEKQFTNNSRMFFRYAFLSADRTRGISARILELDEIQDMLLKNIPIMEECTSHFMIDRQWIYSGTPKTYENAVESYWRRTTQKEWVVRCDACNHWNVLGENNVREKGLSCEKCERLINPVRGQWARFGSKDAEFDGYRITQLMVPWGVWKEIWLKHKNYPRQRFFNEVLGLSCETASSVIGQLDLMRACALGGYPMYLNYPKDRYYPALFGGVDWGKGLGSMTVHVIGGIHDGKFDVLYMKSYDPARLDSMEIIEDIAKTNFKFKVIRCGADWGSGFMENQQLSKVGRPIPVWQYYSSGTQKATVSWNKKGRMWVINRNDVIGRLFTDFKRGQIRLFKWSQFEPFSRDFLGVFPDYHSQTRMLFYNHPADTPDDMVHALNYARTTSYIYHGLFQGMKTGYE